MVIFYNSNGKRKREIVRVEHNVMTPTIPGNMSFEEKKRYYKDEEKLEFVAIPQEMGGYIFNFEVCVDSNNNFIGLQPKSLQ